MQNNSSTSQTAASRMTMQQFALTLTVEITYGNVINTCLLACSSPHCQFVRTAASCCGVSAQHRIVLTPNDTAQLLKGASVGDIMTQLGYGFHQWL